MRLDGLGKPPILQVVPEPKKTAGGVSDPNKEVKEVSDSQENFISSQGQEKLGKIIDILAKAKKENAKKRKNKTPITKVIGEYLKVESTYKQGLEFAQKQRGDKLDTRG